jgi:hypothetical protein
VGGEAILNLQQRRPYIGIVSNYSAGAGYRVERKAMETTAPFIFIIILAVALGVLGILLVLLTNNKASGPTQQPLFRPLTNFDQQSGTHGAGGAGHVVQFSPPPVVVGMRAAAGRGTNGQLPHFAGVISHGPICWTTGMSRTACQCSNCLSRRKPR